MSGAPFFRDIVLVFAAALLGGGIARLLRQPLFVGYVIGGLLVSPFTPGPAIRDVATFELMAQVGVVLLMFSIGIEFSLHEVTRVGVPALVGAPLVMVGVVALAVGLGTVAGWPPVQAAAVGIVISVASTMVVAKLIAERGEPHAPHARLAIGTVLAEDLFTVALIVVLPVLAGGGAGRLGSIAGAVGRAALVLVPFFYLANRAVPALMARVARQRSTEMFILVAMLIGIGTAALSDALGLSLALGAFLGGLIISESEFTHEVLARILPLRDLFSVLFFVSVGTLIRPQDPIEHLPVLALMLSLIILGKFFIRLGVLRVFRYPWQTAALVSVHLAQTGEFSFVLAQVARSVGLINDTVYQALLAASLISILITAALSEIGHRWIEEPMVRAVSHVQAGGGRVLICGFGRVGSAIGEALEAFGIRYTVVDLELPTLEALRRRGVSCVYGDAASEPVLREAGAGQVDLAVVATPDFERTRLAVRRLRRINPRTPILARSEHRAQRSALVEAGATEVIQPEFEAAQTLIRRSLEGLGIPHEQVKTYMEDLRVAEAGLRMAAPPGMHLLQIKAVHVGPGAFADASLRRARIRERTGASIVAIRRRDGALLANPSPDAVLRAGDEVTVMGLPEQIALFESLNAEAGQSAAPRRRKEPE